MSAVRAETTVLSLEEKKKFPNPNFSKATSLRWFFDIYIQGSKYNFKS
jgi:hypothetical protein